MMDVAIHWFVVLNFFAFASALLIISCLLGKLSVLITIDIESLFIIHMFFQVFVTMVSLKTGWYIVKGLRPLHCFCSPIYKNSTLQ